MNLGTWTNPIPWVVYGFPLIAIHMVQTYTPAGERFLIWDNLSGDGHGMHTFVRVWDPEHTENGVKIGIFRPSEQSQFTGVPPNNGHNDMFCGGHTQLADGSPFVAGGHLHGDMGTDKSDRFNASNLAWYALANMGANFTRWYPSMTTDPFQKRKAQRTYY